jgi:hypothetical protein
MKALLTSRSLSSLQTTSTYFAVRFDLVISYKFGVTRARFKVHTDLCIRSYARFPADLVLPGC